MKKYAPALIVALALIITAANYGGGGLTREISGDRFATLAEQNTTAYRTTDNPVPIFAFRIDDALDDLVNDGGASGRGLYWPFLINRIPLSLAINYDNLGTAGVATVADIQRIIAEFDSAGVPIEIVQHFDNALSGIATMTWAELADEINPSELESAFGVNVVSSAIPGNAGIPTAVRHHYAAMVELMQDYGIKYFDGGFAYQTNADSMLHTGWDNRGGGWSALTSPPLSSSYSDRALYPGVVDDPYRLPAVKTIDLGNVYVERGTESYADSWTQLVDGDGNATDANFGNNWSFLYSMFIANGWGAVFAVHDSANASETYDNGEFSPHHVAATARALADSGFIRLGTVSEAYEWALSSWKPGTDLMPTRKYDIPQYTIGDTTGVEIAYLPGWGANNSSNSTLTNAVASATWDMGTNGKYVRTANFPPDLANSTALTGYKDRLGAFLPKTGAAAITFARTGLPPGRYQFEFSSPNSLVQIQRWDVAVAIKMANNQKAMGVSNAYADTLLSVFYDGNSANSISHGFSADATRTLSFTIPGLPGGYVSPWGSDTDLYLSDHSPLFVEGGFSIKLNNVADKDLSAVRLRYLGPVR